VTRIIVSPEAQADFIDIVSYLEKRGGRLVALRYAERLAELYDQLALFPETGAARPKLGANIRIRIVHPFVVIYRYTADQVDILRIVRGSRRITRKMIGGNN
jgi:toxin ParE1/3/4